MQTVYLGLGSNLGDREVNLQAALDRLGNAGLSVSRVSPVYETEPVGFSNQGRFLNLVVEARTDLPPGLIFHHIARIECELGRRRTMRNGPRTIDIDILLYDSVTLRSEALVIPHPRMTERRFVLAPLADLAPDLRHPLTHLTIREMLERVTGQEVWQVAFRPTVGAQDLD
jgi:2-amino-4-hydroxy-6-hydroxymethyldihydropteridine diphosphokinase